MAQSPRATKRALASLTLGAVAATSLAVISTPTASAVESPDSTVFVNELPTTTTAAPTATSWSRSPAHAGDGPVAGGACVLYNGNNGAAYGTRTLSGVLPDSQGGYGALAFSYPADGIQNGATLTRSPWSAAAPSCSLPRYEGAVTAVRRRGRRDGPAPTIGVSDARAARPRELPR